MSESSDPVIADNYRSLDFTGFKGYRVDRNGNCWSRRLHNGSLGAVWKLLKPLGKPGCYRRFILQNPGKSLQIAAHRLVWMAFVGNIPDCLETNHKNGIKDDNRLENLEMVTPSENVRHAIRTGLRVAPSGEKSVASVLTEKQVRKIRRLYARGWTLKQLDREFGICTAHSVVTGQSWRSVKEGIAEKSRRGKSPRRAKGSSVNTAKLTTDQVIEIRRVFAATSPTYRSLSILYGVTTQSISDIINRRSWKHVK